MTRDDLVFRADGFGRYHGCRAEHFIGLNRWISILSIFTGVGVVAGTIAKYPDVAVALGIFVAFANTYRLVAKPDQLALQHEKLAQQWAALLGDVEAVGQPSEKQLAGWTRRAKTLMGQCTEDMKAVKAHCFNETMHAQGRVGTPYQLTAFQKWTKHYLRHTHAFDRQNREAAERLAKARGARRDGPPAGGRLAPAGS